MEPFEPAARAAVSRLFDCPGDALRFEMLAAHASSRTYWRVHLGAPTAPRTLVLMVLHREDRGIKSDEIVEIESTITEIPFVNVHRFLRAFTDAVPEIYFHDEANGLIYLEDLGDTRLKVASAGGKAVFAGIGPRRDVAAYLRGVEQTTAEDIGTSPFRAPRAIRTPISCVR